MRENPTVMIIVYQFGHGHNLTGSGWALQGIERRIYSVSKNVEFPSSAIKLQFFPVWAHLIPELHGNNNKNPHTLRQY